MGKKDAGSPSGFQLLRSEVDETQDSLLLEVQMAGLVLVGEKSVPSRYRKAWQNQS